MRIIKSQFSGGSECQKECPCGNHHEENVEPVSKAPSLGNPLLDGNEPESNMTEMPKKVILIKIIGNPSDVGIEDILKMIEQVIPSAEGAGMDDEVERLQMAAAKLEKAAEYEGWGVFWMANGRAFEKSYKKKKEQKGDAPNAATEAWMETLEEFQKAILDDTFSFTEKYASKKKAEEKADVGGAGGGSSGIMSKEMTDRYKKVKKKAEDEDITEGEAIVDWLDEQQGRKKTKAATVMLLNKIASRMEKGSDPGVAIYEAIDDLQNMGNNVKREALVELATVYAKAVAEDKEEVREVLAFGILDRLTSPLRGLWNRATEGIGDFFSKQWSKGSPASKKLRAINQIRPIVQKKLNEFLRSMATGGAVPAASIQQALNTKGFYGLVTGFMNDISKAIGVRPLPDPNNFSQNGYLNAEQYKNFLAELVLVMDQVNEQNAHAASQAGSGSAHPDITKMTYPEDARLKSSIANLVNRINTISNDLDMALPSHSIPPNIFDPTAVKGEIDAINIPLLMSDSMKNIDKGEDKETEASRISSAILEKMDKILEQYVQNTMRPIVMNLYNQIAPGAPTLPRTQDRTIREQLQLVQNTQKEIRKAWEATRLKIEQEVAKVLDSRYNKINSLRQGLMGQQQAPQPATRKRKVGV